MAINDRYAFQLQPDVQDELAKALSRAVTDSVVACKDRDDELKGYRAILEGWSQPTTNQPWPGACDLQDTSPRELHNTVVAAVYSAARQYPYVCFEGVEREDIDLAFDVETWDNMQAQRYGYEDALYDAVYLSAEGRYAPMYVGVRQDTKRYFHLEVDPPEVDEDGNETPSDPRVVIENDPQPPVMDYRTPNPWDVYFYPVFAGGPQLEQGCLFVSERMELTREDLLLGAYEDRYDEDAVLKMLDTPGARIDVDTHTEDDERDGIERASVTDRGEAQPWECFQVIGRAPHLTDSDGKLQLPEALLHTDCCWMICPALGVIFRQTYSRAPLGLRPYAMFNLMDRPNSYLGEGVVSALADNFEEQTAITRFGINNMNLEASPAMTVAESWLTRYSKWSIAPGRWMPRQPSDPVGPKPLQWDVKSQMLIMPWLQHLDAKAHRLAASEIVNKAVQGNTKAAAIHFQEAMQQSKFDLFLSNIHRGVREALYLTAVTLLKLNEDAGEPFKLNGKEVDLRARDVEKRFRIVPQASTDAISPAQRLAKGMSIAQIVRASIRYQQQAQMSLQSGTPSPMDDELTHRLLQLAGERNPERFVPTPSQAQEEQQGMPMGLPMMPGMGGGGGLPQILTNPADQGAGLVQASPFSPNPNGNGMGI